MHSYVDFILLDAVHRYAPSQETVHPICTMCMAGVGYDVVLHVRMGEEVS